MDTRINSSGFAENVKRALERRLQPNTNLSQADLANCLKVSNQTVWTWVNGINGPSGRHLVALIGFFDAGFAAEVLAEAGVTVAKVGDKREEALDELKRVEAA